jgi:predicted Zn finger-like uncharacterized protein
MIVTCTKCQAKFRVPDEKIGPRGAKVRCSKCQTVFLVRPEGAAAIEAAPASASAAPRIEPGAPRTAPPPLPPPLPAQRPSDPFVAFPAPAPAAAPPVPAADPFAPPSPDPFAAAASPGPDPFALAAQADPFASAAQPDPFAPAAAPFASPEPAARPTDLGELLAGAASAAPSAPGPAEPAAVDAPAAALAGDALALEERPANGPKPVSSAPFDQGLEAGYDAFAGALDPQTGALELASPSDPAPLVTGFHELPQPGSAAPAAEPRIAAATAPPASATAEPQERTRGRPSHLRAVVVNVVALAALLVAAIAILALWRTEGPIDGRALRPSAVLAALRRGGGDAAFAARDVRSGLYERERAPPVLFVRGSVVSRAAAPVPRVQVRVEVLRGGAVVARGEALAGALPTPEELWAAHDATALAAVSAAAARRAPSQVGPGEAVPFLVAIADQPADLAGTTLRVEIAPSERASP